MAHMTRPMVDDTPTPTRRWTRSSGRGLAVADTPWQAIVWNDPVNLMSYVTYVLQKLFGYPEPKATALMLDVHHKGKATVSSGDKEKIEADVAKLHARRACGRRCRQLVTVNGWKRAGRGRRAAGRVAGAGRRPRCCADLVGQVRQMLGGRGPRTPRPTSWPRSPASAPARPPARGPGAGPAAARLHRRGHRRCPRRPARAARAGADRGQGRGRGGGAATLPRGGGQVRADAEQADAWLAALNDVRLALGTALDVSEDMPDELPPDDPRAAHLGVYHWLTYVQDGLVQTRMALL